MKHAFLILGASALAIAVPAYAKPGNGPGHGQSASKHSTMSRGHQGKNSVSMYGYGRGGCPPGLARKNNGCMPRGQYKKLYHNGQRYDMNYGNRWSYNQIPNDLRSQYNFNPNYRYYYGDGYIYQVDPKTMLIQQVVNAILR